MQLHTRKSHAICTSPLQRADCRTPVQDLCISTQGVTMKTTVTIRLHVTNVCQRSDCHNRQYAGPDSVQCLSVRKWSVILKTNVTILCTSPTPVLSSPTPWGYGQYSYILDTLAKAHQHPWVNSVTSVCDWRTPCRAKAEHVGMQPLDPCHYSVQCWSEEQTTLIYRSAPSHDQMQMTPRYTGGVHKQFHLF